MDSSSAALPPASQGRYDEEHAGDDEAGRPPRAYCLFRRRGNAPRHRAGDPRRRQRQQKHRRHQQPPSPGDSNQPDHRPRAQQRCSSCERQPRPLRDAGRRHVAQRHAGTDPQRRHARLDPAGRTHENPVQAGKDPEAQQPQRRPIDAHQAGGQQHTAGNHEHQTGKQSSVLRSIRHAPPPTDHRRLLRRRSTSRRRPRGCLLPVESLTPVGEQNTLPGGAVSSP